MSAEYARTLFRYHITMNRKLWDECIAKLTDDQVTQAQDYSLGSIRDQAVHLMSVDDRWFSGLRNLPVPDFLKPEDFPTRESVRAFWDGVESRMQVFLESLTDAQLEAPFARTTVWHVLMHVAHHGTDHRAQILAMLHRLGAPTIGQDYIRFIWE